MTPHTLLTSQRHCLTTAIAANNTANVDRVGRIMLDGLTEQMRSYLRAIEGELQAGAPIPGHYGENGWAPAITDLIHQSKYQRESSAPARKAAA